MTEARFEPDATTIPEETAGGFNLPRCNRSKLRLVEHQRVSPGIPRLERKTCTWRCCDVYGRLVSVAYDQMEVLNFDHAGDSIGAGDCYEVQKTRSTQPWAPCRQNLVS